MGKQQSGELSGFVHLVERQIRLYEEKCKLARQGLKERTSGPYRFITISRDIGALGDIVASELAACLKWKVYDKEIVDYIARDAHVCTNLIDHLDERAQNLIRDTVERLLTMFVGQAFGNEEYRVALLKALATLAAQGKVILLGHGGAFALQEQPGLHVRITASLPVRIERLSKRWGLSIEETRRHVLGVDAERHNFIEHHFEVDREDVRFFHLVFNTDRFTVDQVVTAIAAVMEESTRADIPVPKPPVSESIAFQSSEGVPKVP